MSAGKRRRNSTWPIFHKILCSRTSLVRVPNYLRARAVNTVISKCLYNRGAYVGVLSSWSLAQCEELDKIFVTEIRRRTKNMKSSQLVNLFQPASAGGHGYQRFSDIIQHRKRTSLNRVLHSADHWSRWAADALVRRGHCFLTTSPYLPSLLKSSAPDTGSPA